MKVEVAVLGSPSAVVLMVSVDLTHHLNLNFDENIRAQKLCESRGGRPGPYGLCGCKATPNVSEDIQRYEI